MTQLSRRFTGIHALYGAEKFDKLTKMHAYIIGVGGVGSWVAEALARTGVGHIHLIDMDVIVESNVNRQLPALTDSFGMSKIEAVGARIAQINPDCQVALIDDFLNKDNVKALLPSRNAKDALKNQGAPIMVFDACDDLDAKLAIALHCRFNKLKLIVAGAAGGKTDPSQLTISDLRDAYQDPLLAKLRDKLKALGINKSNDTDKNNGTAKTKREKFYIKCVFSKEAPKASDSCQSSLNCGGYGSSMMMTCAMAMMMVGEGLALI